MENKKVRFILKTLRGEQLVTASVGETIDVIFPVKLNNLVEEVSIASLEILSVVDDDGIRPIGHIGHSH